MTREEKAKVAKNRRGKIRAVVKSVDMVIVASIIGWTMLDATIHEESFPSGPYRTGVCIICIFAWLRLVVWTLIVKIKSVIVGIPVGISDNYAVAYHLLDEFNLSHYTDYYCAGDVTATRYLSLTMSVYELRQIAKHCRASLWFHGKAELFPHKIRIADKLKPMQFFICRYTLKAILSEVKSCDVRYVQLTFTFTKPHRSRIGHDEFCRLISQWDILQLQGILKQSNSQSIELRDDNGCYVVDISMLCDYQSGALSENEYEVFDTEYEG